MRRSAVWLSFVLIAAPVLAAGHPSQHHVYVCPMDEHPQEFDHPGNCPICGMELVEKEGRLRVAILIFDGAEIIDYAGPWEVFGQTGAKIFTVAPGTGIVHSVFGQAVKPDYDLEHAPAADVLLVPGGSIGKLRDDPGAMTWLRERAASSRYVLSVCNGAFLLARAGLLDGLSATTTATLLDDLASAAPTTRVVRDRRFVDNGRIVTSGGLSAGVDGALHLVERIYGRSRAEEIARDIEYRWDPESKWARGMLADVMLPDVRLPEGVSWQKLASHGDTRRWEVQGRLRAQLTVEELLDLSARQIAAKGWSLRHAKKGKRVFVKRDRDGRSWRTTLTADIDDPASLLETMRIERISPAQAAARTTVH
ncbi:MAG TPA: DJ-1/PfpI family protein [Myxococcales bacterium]|nr:DJ-1/PfpI family protein [Myxococcales bacterium]